MSSAKKCDNPACGQHYAEGKQGSYRVIDESDPRVEWDGKAPAERDVCSAQCLVAVAQADQAQ